MISGAITSVRRRILDRLVLRPSRHEIDPGVQQRVMLKWGPSDETLECFVQSRGKPKEPLDLLVIKFPGTAGRAERSSHFPSNYLSIDNSEVWTWNPPGYGGSSGRASLHRMEVAALDFWRQMLGSSRVGPSTRVWACGNSLGCIAALRVASEVDSQNRLGMLLRNPPPLIDVVKEIARRYPLGQMIHPVADSLTDSMNAPIIAASVTWPCVFLQSELDELVLPAMQDRVIDAYAGHKRVVHLQGLSHGAVATELHEPLIRKSVQWLWEQTDGHQ
ncbi:alpha/beta hydrolase [Stieleria marina]|uniref:Alpha/beta hydrolase family protein n=1 Tax=Stieleria marina TaxID=1930275 RepID=A0A517NMH0_9BACT|nr:Alpha/beta hydrolase family protein [Planctomycetes bacterium K23_9]